MMRRLFKIGAERHEVGPVIIAWHPDGNFIATAGVSGMFIAVFICMNILVKLYRCCSNH